VPGTIRRGKRWVDERDDAVTITAFCTTCQTSLYIDNKEAPVCPVCSTPLVEIDQVETDIAPATG
jgi:hypothetical protein